MRLETLGPLHVTYPPPSPALEEEGVANLVTETSASTARLEAISDGIAIVQIRAGDSSAFNEIAVRYRLRLHSMAYRLLRNHEDAEEVAQEALIRALRGLSGFRGESAFSTWLHAITKNLARNRYRYWRLRKRHATISLDAFQVPGGPSTWGDVIPDNADTPAVATALRDLENCIDGNMHQVEKRQREILALRNVAQASYEEIARTLAISVGTVKSRIARARHRLRMLSMPAVPDAARPRDMTAWQTHSR